MVKKQIIMKGKKYKKKTSYLNVRKIMKIGILSVIFLMGIEGCKDPEPLPAPVVEIVDGTGTPISKDLLQTKLQTASSSGLKIPSGISDEERNKRIFNDFIKPLNIKVAKEALSLDNYGKYWRLTNNGATQNIGNSNKARTNEQILTVEILDGQGTGSPNILASTSLNLTVVIVPNGLQIKGFETVMKLLAKKPIYVQTKSATSAAPKTPEHFFEAIYAKKSGRFGPGGLSVTDANGQALANYEVRPSYTTRGNGFVDTVKFDIYDKVNGLVVDSRQIKYSSGYNPSNSPEPLVYGYSADVYDPYYSRYQPNNNPRYTGDFADHIDLYSSFHFNLGTVSPDNNGYVGKRTLTLPDKYKNLFSLEKLTRNNKYENLVFADPLNSAMTDSFKLILKQPALDDYIKANEATPGAGVVFEMLDSALRVAGAVFSNPELPLGELFRLHLKTGNNPKPPIRRTENQGQGFNEGQGSKVNPESNKSLVGRAVIGYNELLAELKALKIKEIARKSNRDFSTGKKAQELLNSSVPNYKVPKNKNPNANYTQNKNPNANYNGHSKKV